jgi:predicted PurR-regulated permease PerM
MNSQDNETSGYVEKRVLLLLLVGVTLALGYILLPFFGAILWGAIIALLFSPLFRRLLPRLRHWRTGAALAVLTVVVVIVIFPLILVAASLAREAASVYQKLQTEEMNPTLYFHGVFDALPAWVSSLLEPFGLANFDDLLRRLTSALAQGSQFVATQAFSIGQNTFEFIASLFITLYLAFFLIRDGDSVVLAIRRAVPLASAHKKELFEKFTTVIRATVKGNLLVAAIQGALGGLAFWFLGVSGAMLWAVVMAFTSLLPAIGAGLVWAPVAIYFMLTGSIWQGISLVAYGVLVIGLVDNLLRPMLVGKDVRLPDYIVMITTVGGMAVFGINGFVLGPAIAAMFFSVWHIYVTTRVDRLA